MPFSFENYLVCNSGNMFNYFTVRWNEMLTRNQVMPMLYSFDAPTFGNFPVYADTTYSTGLEYLTNPMYTIHQTNWQNMQQGYPSWFDKDGNYTGITFGNAFGTPGNLGTPWLQSGSSSSSSSSTMTPEERSYQTKYNRLLNIVKKLAADSSGAIPTSVKDDLDAAVRDTSKKTNKEKYEALKEAYDKVEKDDIREFIRQNIDNLTTNGKDDGTKIQKVLLSSGYEMDTYLDSMIYEDIHETVNKISNSNGQAGSEILDNLRADKYDVLDVISSWNTKYANSKNDYEKHLMTYIRNYYDKITDKQQRETANTSVVKPLVTALTRKAGELKISLKDTSDKNKLQERIDLLESEYSKIGNKKLTDNFIEAFDDLYLICRQASINEVRQSLIKAYSDMDPDIFNKDLYDEETTEDLIDEGFAADRINGAKIFSGIAEASSANSDDSSTPEHQQINKKSIDQTLSLEDQMSELVGGGEVKELNSQRLSEVNALTGGTYEAAWIEQNVKAGETPKIYVIDNGKIKEVENVKLYGGHVVKENNKAAAKVGSEASAESIRTASNDAISAKNAALDDAEEQRKTEGRKQAELTSDELEKSKKIAKDLRKNIVRLFGTASKHQKRIENIVLGNKDEGEEPKVNARNVLYVLKEYKDQKLCKRFFHKFIDHESWKNNNDKRIEIAQKVTECVTEYIETNKKFLDGKADEEGTDRCKAEALLKYFDGLSADDFAKGKGKELDQKIEKLWDLFDIKTK